jgi:hypothetical protein
MGTTWDLLPTSESSDMDDRARRGTRRPVCSSSRAFHTAISGARAAGKGRTRPAAVNAPGRAICERNGGVAISLQTPRFGL